MSTPVGGFDPQPCGAGAGSGDAVDLENLILCDTLADGSVVGTALAVYDYSTGAATAAPVFVDPVTGAPYVPQGTLMPCPGDAGCLEPVPFHRTTSTTGPVDHPGRQYDITLPINPGFAVQSLQVDATTHAANIVWGVNDGDGETFRQELTAFIEGRVPAAAVVTITNPNAGTNVCGPAAPMQIHIECIRLDQSPPDLIELIYNGGEDLVQNAGYNETPSFDKNACPLGPIDVIQGFHLVQRQDNPEGGGTLSCTSTPNRGWETNDQAGFSGHAGTFELWCPSVTTSSGITPTPRGTPVQEVNSDGNPAEGGTTIWQTFNVPAAGLFKIRVVHGARDAGETHTIRLSTGDTDFSGPGDLINDVTVPATVTGGSGNPWTTLSQDINLAPGLYTLSFKSTTPVASIRGGLFTDMRAFLDRPDLRATATTDDETCVVTVEETTTACADELWSPICAGGNIDSWQNAQTSAILSNAAFWGQAPAPIPGACPASASGGTGGSVAANLAYTYPVCATVGGVRTNLQRVVITDGSGGVLADSFIGPDGGPVATPASYDIGSCTDTAFVNDVVLCDQIEGIGTVSFLRKYVQTLNDNGQGVISNFRDFQFDGTAYTVQGLVVDCADVAADREPACWRQASTGQQVHTGTIRHQDGINAQGWLLFDQNQVLVPNTEPGLTFVPCGQADPFATTGLCLPDGTPIAVVTRHDATADVYLDDGWINLRTGAFTAGNPPVGVVACGSGASVQVSGTFCDMTGTTVNALVLIEYQYNPDGTIASVRIVDATTGATHVPVGTITTCPADASQPEQDTEILCDVNAGVATPFVRDYRRDSTGAITAVSNYTLAGAAYVPTGVVGLCSAGGDSETFVLCDSAAVPNRFLRTYTYTSTGAVAGFTDTTLAGAAFAPTGAVGVCTQTTATDFDFDQVVLCDVNGTAFIRRFTFNSSTGVVTATTNLTLAGAAFAPVGAVGVCSNCCPDVIGEGCSNTGSGRYTAIRAANGTVTLIDSVSGATILAANIITCPETTGLTLTSQGRLVGDADAAWTPGTDVAGVLTSVTFTVLSGTATVTDAGGTVLAGLPAGYSATWTAADHHTLTGPQSIDAIGGNTAVVWTER